jgi:tetratricopeptide (TPR) repeat protein
VEIFLGRSLCLALFALASGCVGARPIAQAPSPVGEARGFAVPRTVITPERAASIPELFQQALALGSSGEHARAALEFQRIHDLDPAGELADDALFQSASEHDLAGELDAAALVYQQLARRYPKSELVSSALVRAIRILMRLDQWPRAGELSELALSGSRELGPLERITVYAASALARLERSDEHAASTFIEKGRALIDEYQLDAAGRLPLELAPLYFSLGELRRRRAERIVFEPLPPSFADALERRCQLLLDAHSAYSDAMRAYDVHFSAIAGYRVGELYERLHQDVMRITPPATADTEEKRILFEAAMRLRYAVLLEKAQKFMEHTLGWVERNGEHSPWVEKTHEAIADIRAAAKREEAALAALPYPRATVEAALLDLQRRSDEKKKLEALPGSAPRR